MHYKGRDAHYTVQPVLVFLSCKLYATITMSRYLNFLKPMHGKATTPSTASGESNAQPKHPVPNDNCPVPRLTVHSFTMGVFVSMGGFIFGYDTGQISGFLVCQG